MLRLVHDTMIQAPRNLSYADKETASVRILSLHSEHAATWQSMK